MRLKTAMWAAGLSTAGWLFLGPNAAAAVPADEVRCHNLIEEIFCGYYQNPLNCVIIEGVEYCETIGAWRNP